MLKVHLHVVFMLLGYMLSNIRLMCVLNITTFALLQYYENYLNAFYNLQKVKETFILGTNNNTSFCLGLTHEKKEDAGCTRCILSYKELQICPFFNYLSFS